MAEMQGAFIIVQWWNKLKSEKVMKHKQWLQNN